MGNHSENKFDSKETFRKLAIEMLKNINLYDEKQNDDAKLAEALIKTENEFLEVYSQFPYIGSDNKIHYPIVTNDKKNIITEDFLDKVVDAINGKADQLDGENFATVLLPNESIENSNIKYAIPQCVKGDITNAKLYHCLLNPGSGISDADNQYDNFYDYLHDKVAVKDHLRIFDENGHATKEKLVEYMNDLNKNMLITEFEDFIEKYGNCTISENKVDEIFDDNGEKEFYYIMEFYKSLVAKGIGDFREIIKKNLSNLETFNDNLKDVKLCNLELSPVRSKVGKTIINMIDENPFAVSIILRRICIYELSNDDGDSVQPIFIFRSYGNWKNRINKYIKNYFKQADTKDIIDYLTKNYFLKLNQSGTLSKNNIKTEKYGVKSSSAKVFIESLNEKGIDFDTIIPKKLELIEENEFTKEEKKRGKVSIIKVKYVGMDFKLEVAEQNNDKIKNLFFTSNLDKERLIDEIKLALRAYKYIDDAQKVFSSGLKKTNKPKNN